MHTHSHTHAHVHTHTGGYAMHTQAEQQSQNVNDAYCLRVCKFSRLQPSTHHFPRSPSVSSKDKAWPYCPQLISSSKERDEQHIRTHIHTWPFYLTEMLWSLWHFNGSLQWLKQCNLHADTQTQQGRTNAYLILCCLTTCDMLQHH